MKQGIYSITNTVNNHLYIGSSVHIENRWKNHRYYLQIGQHRSPKLQRAWDKYGAAAFVFEIVELVEPEELLTREQFYLDGLAPTYNIKKIAGNGRLGMPHTEETKQKIARLRIGFRFNEQTKEKMSQSAVNRFREGRGSLKRGEAAYGAKLTDDDVRAIRQMNASKQYPKKVIMARFGVSRETVRLIGLRKIWSHVE